MIRFCHRALLLLPILSSVSCMTQFRAPLSNKIEDVRGDQKWCPLHNEPLVERKERIDWERGSFDPLYYRLRTELFPFSYRPSATGDLALFNYCPKCRVARAIYERDEELADLYPSFGIEPSKTEAFIQRQREKLNDELPATR